MKPKEIDRLAQVRDTILNRGLVFASVAGVMTYIASLTQYFIAGFRLSFVTDFISLGIIIVLTWRRHFLSARFKTYIVILAIFVVVGVDIYQIGVLSANKVLLVLVPFFGLIALSKKETIFFGIAVGVLIAILSTLHFTGYLTVSLEQNLGPIAWLINFAIISIVAFLMVIIVTQFNRTYESMIADLRERNCTLRESEQRLEAYKDQLEETVERRTIKLKKTNEDLRKKKAETEEALNKLQRAQDELVKSEKLASIGMLSSGIAHEINNPLNFIRGGITGIEAELSERYGEDEITNLKPMLDMANEGVNRAAGIVRSMNQFNHNSPDEKCYVPNIIDNCIQILGLGSNEDITITSSFPKDFPYIQGNNGELHQVFMNLFTNALDAINSKGEINITPQIHQKTITVSLSDNGSGMSDEVLKRLGEPFFTTKDVGEGTGLGLYIVSKIIRDHRGSIRHTSQEGIGTDVMVKLPLAKP